MSIAVVAGLARSFATSSSPDTWGMFQSVISNS
jgi:hypothetical protein